MAKATTGLGTTDGTKFVLPSLSMATEDLLGAVLALTPEQRERLAEEIQVSVAHDRGHDPAQVSPDAELTAQLDRRIEALDRGEAKTVTLADAQASVMRRLASVSKK